jgi:hypothetical protein
MKRGQWALILLLVLIIAAIVGYFATVSSSEQRLRAARATLDKRIEAAQAAAHSRRPNENPFTAEAYAPPIGTDELVKLLARIDAGCSQEEWIGLVNAIGKADHPWPPDLLARVQAWLEAHQDLVAQARDLAARGTNLDLAAVPMEDVLPLVQKLNAVVRLLTINAEALAALGHHPEAVPLLKDAVAVSDLLGSQHLIIAQQRRSVAYHLVLDALRGVMRGHQLSDAQLGELERQLRGAHQRDQFAAATAGESRLVIARFDEIRVSTLGRLAAPVVNWNEASYIEYMNSVADEASRPYYAIAATTVPAPNLPITHFYTRAMLGILQPALGRTIEEQARHEARVDMARIAIALERHYLETGTYPVSLDPVASVLGEQVPVDPFTGRPYQYQLSDDGYRLYSLGVNQTDDGGVQGRGPEGDLVWR